MMFGGNNMGRVGGGVGGGGGSLLRSVGRAVARANLPGGTHIQEPTSSSTLASSSSPPSPSPSPSPSTSTGSRHVSNGNNHLSVVSPFASCNVPVLPTWRRCEELDWVSVDGCSEDERLGGFVVGPVPSEDEVHCAVSALQQVFSPNSYANIVRDKFGSEVDNYDEERQFSGPSDLVHHVSPPGSDIDWIEPSLCMCNSKVLQCNGSERVYEAFHLLRTEPFVQKMVKSLSSDEAVWNAVLNNEVVRELRESLSSADGDANEEPDPEEETNIVKWIFDGTRAKIMELVDNITKIVNGLFQFPEDGKTSTTGVTDAFKEKLRTSFMLSVMVLLVVVVARANKA